MTVHFPDRLVLGLATNSKRIDRAPRRFEVITGDPERRAHSEAFKAALVSRSFEAGVCIADLAREHEVHPQLLYTWRAQARRGQLALPAPGAPTEDVAVEDPPIEESPIEETPAEEPPIFATVALAAEPAPQRERAGEIIVEIGEMRLRIGPDVAPERAAALISALRAAP